LTAGCFVLALYLAACSPAGLGLAALLGSFDPSHQVQVHAGERGLAVVLHHGGNCAGHRHGVVARALTCFAQPASAADPDHVIQFSAADSLSRKAQISLPPLAGSAQPALALVEKNFSVSAPFVARLADPRPPPGGGEALRCLRSTVLLI